jgi:hypothetical protein
MNPKLKYLAALLLFVNYCDTYATTVVIVVTPEAIIVGADGKTISRITGKSGPVKKAFIIQHRLIVTALGNANVGMGWDNGPQIDFRFAKWIMNIDKKCPKDVSVAELTRMIEKESTFAFKDADLFIADGAFDRQYPQKSFLDFIISGYEAGIPTITRVKFEIDWEKRHLNAPIVTQEHPRTNQRADFDFFVYGRRRFDGNELINRKGDGYKELLAVIPKELPKLSAMQNLTLHEATNVCLAILRVNSKHFDDVGAPYSITSTVPLGIGVPREVTYPK